MRDHLFKSQGAEAEAKADAVEAPDGHASRVGQSSELTGLQLKADPAARDALVGSMKGGAEALGAEVAQTNASTPGAVAKAGVADQGSEIPHKAEMEESFGASFDNVKAHFGADAQRANADLDSKAYTLGDHVAFADSSPSKALVAHELTHTLQQRGATGPALKAQGVGGGVGLDTAGEAQAEAVEAAVASGGRASDVIGPLTETTQADEAIQRKYGLTMTFDLEGFKRDHQYKLWGKAARIPLGSIGPVPIFFLIDPSVVVYQRTGVKVAGDPSANFAVGMRGSVGLGLSGGVPDTFEPYLTGNPTVSGSGSLTLGQGKQFTLTGGIDFAINGYIGAKIMGGFNPRFQLANLNIFKLTGLHVDNNGLNTDKIGFEWSDDIQAAWDAMESLYNYVADGVGQAVDWATDTVTDIADEYQSAWRSFKRYFSW